MASGPAGGVSGLGQRRTRPRYKVSCCLKMGAGVLRTDPSQERPGSEVIRCGVSGTVSLSHGSRRTLESDCSFEHHTRGKSRARADGYILYGIHMRGAVNKPEKKTRQINVNSNSGTGESATPIGYESGTFQVYGGGGRTKRGGRSGCQPWAPWTGRR